MFTQFGVMPHENIRIDYDLSVQPQDIMDLINENEKQRKKYNHLYNLYKGKHLILNKRVSRPDKPNNRIVNNFYVNIVDTIVGYMAGNPVTFTTKKSEAIQDVLDDIFIENYFEDIIAEVVKEMSIKGKSYIMVYQDEQGETNLMRIPAEEMIYIKNATTNKPEMAIRYFYMENREKELWELYVEVYTDKEVYYFNEENGKSLQVDYSKPVNPVPHNWGRLPIVEILNNEEEMGDIEQVESLVDNFNKVFSYASDEHESYRNAYIAIKNMIVDEETVAQLREEGIVELGENGEFSFVTKDSNQDAMDKHLDRLEANIYKFTNTPNMSDENFANNTSGVAMKYKLFGLETKCMTKERKLRKAFAELLQLLSVVIQIKTGEKLKLREVDIQFKRNIPANMTEAVDNVVKLNSTGLIDAETLLSQLPFISNPTAILEKMEAQKKESYSYPNLEEDEE